MCQTYLTYCTTCVRYHKIQQQLSLTLLYVPVRKQAYHKRKTSVCVTERNKPTSLSTHHHRTTILSYLTPISWLLFKTPPATLHAQFCPCCLSPDAVSALHNSLQQFCLRTVSLACPTASSEGAWDPVTSQPRPMGQNRKICEGAINWGVGEGGS